ncbi:MAG TPA: hypothetical protein VKB06_00490 [Nitrososphaera sp.]|nr:hypothetical protein [Nitrososphaera sp.]
MSQILPSQLLEGWVYWIFPQPWGSDIGNDSTGARTEQLNDGRDIWYLSGTWGDAGATPGKVNREIRVREGTSIFIVLASSHATPEELGNQDSADQELLQHAKAVHNLWDKTDLRIDGKSEATQREETRVLTPYISDGSYYSRLAKSGVVRMATVAEVLLLDSARVGKEGEEHTIELDAHSRTPTKGEPNEPEYREDVTYRITVQ